MDNVLAIILAGGGGERVNVLAQERAKPAIPFAAKYRVIDFTLSNCMNSGIHKVAIVTQYQPLSLIDHIGIGTPWGLDRPDCVMRVLQAHLTRNGRGWYKGTADAVYQNLPYIQRQDAELVLILGGDHVYRMDYSDMLKLHQQAGAEVTLAVTPSPGGAIEQFGTVMVAESGAVTGFQEKVKRPKSNLAFMGVYVFNRDVLQHWLEEDARNVISKHDLSGNVVPRMVGKSRIFAYRFDGYWRDVGTIQTYWRTNMDLFDVLPSLLFSDDWPLRTKEEERPPAIVSETAKVINSLVSNGCIIEGHVEHSVLSPGVKVAEGAIVKDSIIFSDSIIGPHAVVDYSILDKEVVIGDGCHIGYGDDFQVNREEPKVLNIGISIVGKRTRIPAGVKIGRNCAIHCGAGESNFLTSEIQSGETIWVKRRGRSRKV